MFDQIKKNNEINSVLKYWADIAKENPNINFDSESMHNAIYKYLINLGVPQTEKRYDLKDGFSPSGFRTNTPESREVYVDSAFNNWLSYYKNNNKLDVFVDPSWDYFCQFISKDRTAYNQDEHIKVYIPLNSSHIEEGAKQIFNFLNENNISHVSKIGKHIRFDDIVIRVIKKEDAEKLLDFVKKNKFIQAGLIKPNPFAVNKNGIALASDGRLSYNSTIATLIAMYIGDRKTERKLSKVNHLDFLKYLTDLYKKEFISKTYKKLQFKFGFSESNIDEYNNYREVIALIINVQNPNYNFENLIDHYKKTSKYREPKTESTNLIDDNTNMLNLLTETVETMKNRFNSEDQALRNISAYLITNDETYLTRQNNLRDKVKNSNFRNFINNILKERKINIIDLYYETINKTTYNNSRFPTK